MEKIKNGKYVFYSPGSGRPLSDAATGAVLDRMNRHDIVPHGFRSTFRDWAAERTDYPAEVAEMALAHAVSDKVEAAYRRGDLVDKRRGLMNAWASHCITFRPPGRVVDIGGRREKKRIAG
jgi:integrase